MITLALVGGVVGLGVVVAVLNLGGRVPSMTLAMPMRAGIAVFGVALLGAAQVVGHSLFRPTSQAGAEITVEKIRTGVIVAMGLRESVGLLGSVLGLLTGELLLMSGLVAASAATMILGLPGRDELEDTLRRADL
jgi:hypothetical protein